MKDIKLKKGWLPEVLWDAHISLMQDHSPRYHVEVMGQSVTLPVSEDEASELYRRMASRFREWTGKDIRNFKPTPRRALTQEERR